MKKHRCCSGMDIALNNVSVLLASILKELLCELIRKSVAKSHPKLLLRR